MRISDWSSDVCSSDLGYNDIDEANFIVEEIKMLHAEGAALDEIALLYRSNAQSRVLEHALFSAGLPYRVYGGLRFFERSEIKHALAYLRLISNPEITKSVVSVKSVSGRVDLGGCRTT